MDSDTIKVRVDLWPGLHERTSARLLGADTPEKFRPRCQLERAFARKASAFVESLAPPGAEIRLRDVRRGKYAGRVVARVQIANDAGDWIDLGQLLISRKFAVPYFGGRKADWCAILKKRREQEEDE